MSGNPIVHIEIPARDPLQGSQFYAQLFGWETSAVSEMDYVTFRAGPEMGGGFPRIDGQMYKPDDVTVYIGVDDIEATLKRIEELGGKTIAPKMEIPGMGWFAFFSDPSGNRMALYTAMAMPG